MLNDDMRYDQAGFNLTMLSEDVRLKAYPDPGSGGDPWTIGYGHTGPEVRQGMTCTHLQAEAWLRADVFFAEKAVKKMVTVKLSQGQFDALVDLVFNIGATAFQGSTLLRMLNAGDYAGADGQFKRWNMSKGKVMPGLVTRRDREEKLFDVPPTFGLQA